MVQFFIFVLACIISCATYTIHEPQLQKKDIIWEKKSQTFTQEELEALGLRSKKIREHAEAEQKQKDREEFAARLQKLHPLSRAILKAFFDAHVHKVVEKEGDYVMAQDVTLHGLRIDTRFNVSDDKKSPEHTKLYNEYERLFKENKLLFFELSALNNIDRYTARCVKRGSERICHTHLTKQDIEFMKELIQQDPYFFETGDSESAVIQANSFIERWCALLSSGQ